jgi:hypothetical protein
MPFDDLPLSQTNVASPGLEPEAPPPSPTRWVVVGALAVVAGSLLALWWISRAKLDTATIPPTTATDVAVRSNRPKRQPIQLPSLDGSDPLLREMVAALSHHPLLARLLATDRLVRSATLAVEQIGDGRTPAEPLRPLRPATRLAILGTESGRIDPKSYARWNGPTASLTSVNPAEAAQVYVNVKPLFDQAYRELGHPKGDFDDAIVRAIGTLAGTPPLSTDPELLRRPGYYEHADPTLRSLLPVQKQLLLVGPDNRQKIMDWLMRLATSLDLKIQ